MQLGNALNWFEIPVNDFDRARKFYETIFDYQMPESTMGKIRMGFFLYDMPAGKVGGAICFGEVYKPSQEGCLIYLNCQPDLQIMLNRVKDAGGSILTEKKLISPDQNIGYWASIIDSEGNKVALHSMS